MQITLTIFIMCLLWIGVTVGITYLCNNRDWKAVDRCIDNNFDFYALMFSISGVIGGLCLLCVLAEGIYNLLGWVM